MVEKSQKKTVQDFRQVVRDELGVRTIYWLAKESGVRWQRLYAWLGGKQATINSDDLARVFAALGVRCR